VNVRRIVPTEMAIWFWRLLRWSYSAYFIYVGSIILGELVRGTVTPYPQPNAAAQAFSNAPDASGFMNPALVASYLGGGLALIFQRTAPLGLAMLGPPVAIILLFQRRIVAIDGCV
jgi:hypothetical protein